MLDGFEAQIGNKPLYDLLSAKVNLNIVGNQGLIKNKKTLKFNVLPKEAYEALNNEEKQSF